MAGGKDTSSRAHLNFARQAAPASISANTSSTSRPARMTCASIAAPRQKASIIPSALYHLNTGNQFGGDPAIGSWVSYGLGTVTKTCPRSSCCRRLITHKVARRIGRMVFCRAFSGHAFARQWFPPARFAATQRHNTGDAAQQSRSPCRTQPPAHANGIPATKTFPPRMEAYELAFRMQRKSPNSSRSKGNPRRRKAVRIGETETEVFGTRCLLARRLVERACVSSRFIPAAGIRTTISNAPTPPAFARSTNPSRAC